MTDDECYDGLAHGGKVTPSAELPDMLSSMGDYIIPATFAQKWCHDLLDSINNDGVE